MKARKVFLALTLTGIGFSTGCGNAMDAEEGSGRATSEISGGIAMNDAQVQLNGLVAVYHPSTKPGQTWSPRPCTGTVIYSVNSVTTVLTARHCVTIDGTVDGAIAPISRIMLSPTRAPGPANPNPPAGSVFPNVIIGSPLDGTPSVQHDIAAIGVPIDWSSRAAARFGIWVGEPSALVGTEFSALGYGISVNDNACTFDQTTTGAGVARYGGMFSVMTGSRGVVAGVYTFINSSDGSQALTCGDDGGPDQAGLGTDDFGWTHIIGVHSTGFTLGSPSGSTVAGGYFTQHNGGFGTLMSSDFARNLDVAMVAGSSSNIILADPNVVFPATMTYVPSDLTLRIGFGCLDLSGVTPVVQPCTFGPTQHWTPTIDRQFKNMSNGQCLTVSGSTGITMQTCSFATLDISLRQHWAFHIQP